MENKTISERYAHIIDGVVKDYREKELKVAEIAKKYEISEATLYRILKELGETTTNKRTSGIKMGCGEYKAKGDYFDVLNKENVKDLAFLYAQGHIYVRKLSSGISKRLCLSAPDKYKDLLINTVQNIGIGNAEEKVYPYQRECSHRASIGNNNLCDRLEELQFKKEFPIFEDKEMNWNFYNSYFVIRANISRDGIGIGKSHTNDENLIKYLNSIGVEEFKEHGNLLKVIQIDEVDKLMIAHPMLLDKMITYCTEGEWSQKFSKLMVRARNREAKKNECQGSKEIW